MQAETRAMVEVFGEALLADPNSEPLKEAFDKVRHMLSRQDAGWETFQGGGSGQFEDQFGLTLSDLKEWGRKIRPSIIASPWVGAGFRRRAHYVWQNRIRYGNIPENAQGRKSVKAIIDTAGNQMHFFGPAARRSREECLYAEGIAFWTVNDRTKQIESIPVRQIVDELLEPNGLGFVWAYLRQWAEFNLATGEWEPRKRWYFTDRFVDKRVPAIKRKGDPEVIPVDQDHVIVDQIANSSTGFAYGSPDAVAAWIWNGIARDATMDGVTMQQALASFAFKATAPTKESGKDAALRVATADGAGQTVVGNAATDLAPLASAGKGYDFSTLRFLVSMVATALDISVIHLTANPGDAGSSYGSAQTLDLPTRLAMEARRDEHIEIDKRILRLIGVPDPDVSFVPFTSGEETYRAAQTIYMGLQHDAYSRQEARDQLDDLFARPNGKVPTEAKRDSVLKAVGLAKANPKPAAAADDDSSDDGATPQVASPSQGKSTGAGGQGSAGNDIRRDKKKV